MSKKKIVFSALFLTCCIGLAQAADAPKLSTEANEMLSLMSEFAPKKQFKAAKGLKFNGNYYEGKIGKIKVLQLVVGEDGLINDTQLFLEGGRVDHQLVPVLKKMYGDPSTSKIDNVQKMAEDFAKAFGSTYKANDHKFIQYKWVVGSSFIELSGNDDLIFKYDDGRNKNERPKQTYLRLGQ